MDKQFCDENVVGGAVGCSGCGAVEDSVRPYPGGSVIRPAISRLSLLPCGRILRGMGIVMEWRFGVNVRCPSDGGMASF